MKGNNELLHVASPSRCNTQQTAESVQQPAQQSCNSTAGDGLKALADRVLTRNSERNSHATDVLHSPATWPVDVQHSPRPGDPYGHGYTAAELEEMDRLLHQLAQLEHWSPERLADELDQRRRMAPVRVPQALHDLRLAVQVALAPWPEKPTKRSRVELCVISGGKR